MIRLQRHLYEHEAAWGRRLRMLLRDSNPEMQLLFVHEYGLREQVAVNTQSYPPFTGDLDGLLAIKPWLRERVEAVELYDNLLRRELIPPPRFYKAHESPETLEMFQELEKNSETVNSTSAPVGHVAVDSSAPGLTARPSHIPL